MPEKGSDRPRRDEMELARSAKNFWFPRLVGYELSFLKIIILDTSRTKTIYQWSG